MIEARLPALWQSLIFSELCDTIRAGKARDIDVHRSLQSVECNEKLSATSGKEIENKSPSKQHEEAK